MTNLLLTKCNLKTLFPVYVVAGKMMSEEEAKKLSSDRIKNIVVAKKGSKEAVKLGGEKQGNQHDYISIELK